MSKTKAAATPTLRFKTHNYKHELRLQPGSPRWVGNYTDAMWETLFRSLAERDFTGIVFYPGYHPFEYILDYAGFAEAATQPAEQNAAVRATLNRALAVAHKHGLKTFMQHYITHYTEPLAKSLGLPSTGRLADVVHPEIARYQRWCYREMFRQCPDLDGLYFNFESAGNAWQQILDTAIVEFNAMERKPIAVYRLWNLSDVEGVRTLIKSYKGKTILSHKVSDTNDTYYLPMADSRAGEWKKLLRGLDFEFIYCFGPCHNCGTNLCTGLWADYDFAWDLTANAEKQGADGIGFHTVHEFFAPDMADAPKVYSERDLDLARLNVLHLDAFVDYVHGVRKTPSQLAARMAARMKVPPEAGKSLLAAIEASSRPIPLTFQQFCYGSAFDGYLNPGRYSHIQDPFYYYPASEMNNQGTRAMWSPVRCDTSWIEKRVDRKVCPDNLLQYLIDYVNPKKRPAVRNPGKIAAMLDAGNRKAVAALATYREIAGAAAAEVLEKHMRSNLVLADYVRHEILAAIQLYANYFAPALPGFVARLKRGIAELEGVKAAIAGRPEDVLRVVQRDFMFDRWDPDREINLARQLLAAVASTPFPFAAFREYVASRREYNEIRRTCRAARCQNRRTLAAAEKQLKAAIRRAKASIEHLRDEKWRAIADNVVAWLMFLETQRAQMTPPEAVVGKGPGEWLTTFWDHAFRAGENFLEDFLSFFRTIPAGRASQIRLRVWRTGDALAVTMREDGVDPAQRKGMWEEHRTTGSASFVERVYVDVEGKGRSRVQFIVWPKGESVSLGQQTGVPVRTEYREEATACETTAYFPFKVLGRRPKKGDVWRFNLTANPAVTRNTCFTWAPQYDAGCGNPYLLGKLRFE